MKHFRYLDIARGIGLLLVIISHSCGLSPYLINYYIPLFFVVSGYLYKEGRSYGENIRHKAKRLLIPYFGYSAVLLAFYAATGRSLAETKDSAFGILYSRYCLYDTTMYEDNVFLFTVANGAMWYLTAYFSASLVYHLVADRCIAGKKVRGLLRGCSRGGHDGARGASRASALESGYRLCRRAFYARRNAARARALF